MQLKVGISFGVLSLVVCAGVAAGDAPGPGAAWELKMLGVNDEARRAELASYPKQRTVKLAIVGQGGVSAKLLKPMLVGASKIVYHDCSDPASNTHDTQAAGCGNISGQDFAHAADL